MSNQLQSFLAKSTIKASNVEHRRKLQFNIGKYNAVVPFGKKQFENLEQTKQTAKNIKWQAIENLATNLETFEANISARGAKVLWAENDKQALEFVGNICKEKQCKTVVKSKSMVTEEIHLNHYLESIGVESVETDLGEYIQQLDGETPYHIVTPAMHKSKEDVANLFARKLGVPNGLTPEEITQITRKNLREKYAIAEVGISGANFIVADTGSIVVTENEGNARLSFGLPKTHIVIVGIEKMIPSIKHLSLFLPLLATYGTGQKITVYNSIISGPKQSNETDGPTDMYVILLDNGRTNLLKDVKTREALYCIRCGACLNACPIYKNIGGHAYEATYSGPIGSVITPHLKDKNFNHLSHSSSLCGACTETCPIKINLHEMLLYNRSIADKKITEKAAWQIWKQATLHRSFYNLANAKTKNYVVNKLFTGWLQGRAALRFGEKTFNQMWKEKNGNGK